MAKVNQQVMVAQLSPGSSVPKNQMPVKLVLVDENGDSVDLTAIPTQSWQNLVQGSLENLNTRVTALETA